MTKKNNNVKEICWDKKGGQHNGTLGAYDGIQRLNKVRNRLDNNTMHGRF